MDEQLQKKEDRAIKLLVTVASANPDEPIEIAVSGGKDSDVCAYLARKAGIKCRIIYKNTTIDPSGTIQHCKDMGAEILNPKNGNFFDLVAKNGFPSRFRRFCCVELKEYKVLDKVVMGVRKSESNSRAARYNEPTECKYYGRKKTDHVEAIYPILDWTDQDIVDYVTAKGIKLHSLYYREDGTIDPKRRLGCLCCPLKYYKTRIKDFQNYPVMVKLYCKAGNTFRENHPNAKVVSRYKDVYEWFVRDTFYPREPDWQKFKDGIDDNYDFKGFLEDFFHISF